MRFLHPDGTIGHTAYCTNVHPAEDFDGVIRQLARFAGPIRDRLEADRLGLGLWLARDMATALVSQPQALSRLRAELAARGLEVVTLNGSPYERFGGPEVKHRLYAPDWSRPARAWYTADLARILTGLMPDDVQRGSISTLPLGWGRPWCADRDGTARRQIGRLGAALKTLAKETGRSVRVGFEPAPGCAVETTEDALTHLTGLDPDRFGICLDTCHLAVAHEDPAAALARLGAAGLPLVKVQASVALESADPQDPADRKALQAFVEPRFLHQTREAGRKGLLGADDLDQALGLAAGRPLPGKAPWRVHFHLPLHASVAPPLRGTHQVLRTTLAKLFGGPRAGADHLEVGTYTWTVPPPRGRPVDGNDLIAGVAAEMNWVRAELTALGLKELGV